MPPAPRPAPRPTSQGAAQARPLPPRAAAPDGPPASLRAAASAALVLLAVLGLAWAGLALATARARARLASLPRLELRAEAIKEAYAELAERGAVLKARLDNSDADPEDVRDRIHAAARAAGLKVKVGDSVKLEGEEGVRTFQIAVTGAGREERVLKFLGEMDALPAVVRIEEARLTGAGSGQVGMEITIHHLKFGARLARRYRDFVEKLPALAAPRRAEVLFRRSGELFLPSVVSTDDALEGWASITLNGFSGDKALFQVDGEALSVDLGRDVNADVAYIDKLAVNQAMLKRKSDGVEVILTIGSRSFALKPHKARGMSEFVLTLQKRAASDLITNPGRP